MKWEKIGNRSWRTVGAKGSYFIDKSSLIEQLLKTPKQKVSDAKAMCEENQYWEDEEKC